MSRHPQGPRLADGVTAPTARRHSVTGRPVRPAPWGPLSLQYYTEHDKTDDGVEQQVRVDVCADLAFARCLVEDCAELVAGCCGERIAGGGRDRVDTCGVSRAPSHDERAGADVTTVATVRGPLDTARLGRR